MYELNDTIAAVSSPTTDKKVITRISGPCTIEAVNRVFNPSISRTGRHIVSGCLVIDDELKIDAEVYLFLAPHSYTGQDLAEIHCFTNPAISKALLGILLTNKDAAVRTAEAGEFTARSYMNGKIDLAQAEAVCEIVAGSNRFQLSAAEKLFAGQLGKKTGKTREAIMNCLSLIEAGLDFAGEDIEFISQSRATEKICQVKSELEQLLAGSIGYESVIDLPAVAITGSANAGKSSLLNKLLGRKRSIVSKMRKTTRDVLSGSLELEHCCCVLFDCAGLLAETDNLLDELSQQAANEALRNSTAVVFCVDIAKPDWDEDIQIRKLIEQNRDVSEFIPVAAKSDLLSKADLAVWLAELNKLFGIDFLPISSQTGVGLKKLRERIDKKIMEAALGSDGAEMGHQIRETKHEIALTARHKQAVIEAIDNIGEAITELNAGNDEVCAMLLRSAYQQLSQIQQPQSSYIDEQILTQIFSRFCIGK